MYRLPELVYEDFSEEQRRVYDSISPKRVGFADGPFRVWLESPEFADRAQALGAFCRHGTVLPAQLSELAILVTSAHWRSGYEWHVHAPIGLTAGLDVSAVEAIRVGETPHFVKSDEAIVYGFAKELVTTHRVSDATYKRAVEAFGASAVVELVGIIGYYTLISMTINVFKMPVPAGSPEPFGDE